MAPELPGYYFDAEKGKYFKIQKSHHATPASAAWTAEAVKKRRAEDQAAQAAQERARRLRYHIKRHGLRRDLVSSALVARELALKRVAEPGFGAAVVDEEVGAAVWADGLVPKGHVPFAPSFAQHRYANMACFYVGGEDDKTGLGVAYATMDEETLVGAYIPTDANDEIRFSPEAPASSGRNLAFRTEMIRCPQMSSIKYHSPSHKILLTSREPDHSCGLYFFSPPTTNAEDERPHWLLGETSHYQRLSIRHGLRDEWLVHGSTPAPASSDLLCVIGTNAGILRVRSNETMSWIVPKHPTGDAGPLPQEIFDQDFVRGDHNVLLAGGRQPRVWITDLRCSGAEWRYIRHPSSVAHLRCINDNQFVVAGLQNSMALYDMRYFSSALRFSSDDNNTGSGRASNSSNFRGGNRNGTEPLLYFPGYRNEAHFHTGWDVSTELGAVAAAQDDGTVRLFSLRSGRILPSPAALARVKTDTPIRSLMFQRMPHERLPSLFVGEGPHLRKFTYGTMALDDEA